MDVMESLEILWELNTPTAKEESTAEVTKGTGYPVTIANLDAWHE